MSLSNIFHYFLLTIRVCLGFLCSGLLVILIGLPLELLLKRKNPSKSRLIFNQCLMFCVFSGTLVICSKFILPFFIPANLFSSTSVDPHLLEGSSSSQTIQLSETSKAVNSAESEAASSQLETLKAQRFFLENDKLKLEISAIDGNITNVWLKEHAKELGSEEAVELSVLAHVRSGWKVSSDEIDYAFPKQLIFSEIAPTSTKEASSESETAQLKLQSRVQCPNTHLNLILFKEWRLESGSHRPTFKLRCEKQPIAPELNVAEAASHPLEIAYFCEIAMPEKLSDETAALFSKQKNAAAQLILSDHQSYTSLDLAKVFSEGSLLKHEMVSQGWIGVSAAPFLSVIFPAASKAERSFEQYRRLDPIARECLLGFRTQKVSLEEALSQDVSFDLFFGPMEPALLATIAPKLELSLGHANMFAPILAPLGALFIKLMAYFYNFCHNWGWSLLAAALSFQCVTSLPLFFYSLRSERRRRKAERNLQAISEFKKEQEITEKTKQLFQVGFTLISLLLFFIIRPFIAYSIHFRHQPFFMQMNDLSQPERSGFLILLLILFQKLSTLGSASASISSASPKHALPGLATKIGALFITALALLARHFLLPFSFFSAMSLCIGLLVLLYRDPTVVVEAPAFKEGWKKALFSLPWQELLKECLQHFITLWFMQSSSMVLILLLFSAILASIVRNSFSYTLAAFFG